jgi:UDP-N-acetylmuramyl pentapeptide phosphotransferase/UDP-N-acetylglucosamine-1-phosphate transferase
MLGDTGAHALGALLGAAVCGERVSETARSLTFPPA